MRFGILASHQYERHDDLRQRLRELFELSEVAAAAGYDSIWAINHFLANLETPQVISMTASLLQHSGTMTVGTAITLLPFYNPVHIAEEFATLDQLSGGRIVLGVGSGYRKVEFQNMGVSMEDRGAKLSESVRLIRALWSCDVVDFEGTFYSVHGARIGVSPLRTGGPPIYIGGGSRPAVRRAARLGDAWLAPGNSPLPNYLRNALSLHDEALAEAGRSREGRDYPVMLEVYCAETTEQARSEASRYVQHEFETYGQYEEIAWQKERMEELFSHTFVLGDPDVVATRVAQMRALGFNHFIFRPFWLGMPHALSRRSVELIAKEVMPRFRDAAPAGAAVQEVGAGGGQ